MIIVEPEKLSPLVKQIVAETVHALHTETDRLGDRLAYSEEEAAEMLGLKRHQLRDERRRGRIPASRIVGRNIRYTRDDLLKYLLDRRINSTQE